MKYYYLLPAACVLAGCDSDTSVGPISCDGPNEYLYGISADGEPLCRQSAFEGSAAAGISSAMVDAWNEAASHGDHATAGYLLASSFPHVYNVRDFGAVGDGEADDTAAIAAAIATVAAAGEPGVVLLPPGVYNTTGGYDVSGIRGLQVVGTGSSTSVFRLTHPTNDLFFWTTETMDQAYRSFGVTSDGKRTGGWVFRGGCAYDENCFLRRTRFADLDVEQQTNGIWIAQYTFVWLDRIFMNAFVGQGGTGFRAGQPTSTDVNQGAEIYLRSVQIYGIDTHGVNAWALDTAFVIEDTEAVYLLNCGAGGADTSSLVVRSHAGGHAPQNHFFHQSVFDATRSGPSVHLTGTGTVIRLMFTGDWFASAGALSGFSNHPACLEIDAATIGPMQISGSVFHNCAGSCLQVAGAASGAGAPITATGNSFLDCGLAGQPQADYGMGLDVALNHPGPLVVGNDFLGTHGPAVASSGTSNWLSLVANRFVSPPLLGTTPFVLEHNSP